MTGPSVPLAVITSCEGCGACCRVVTFPPFRRVFDGEGEDAWERLRRDDPALMAELLDAEKARRDEGLPAYGSPCLWYDRASALCLHHDRRPRACREFAIGAGDCLDARRRAGIDRPRSIGRPEPESSEDFRRADESLSRDGS